MRLAQNCLSAPEGAAPFTQFGDGLDKAIPTGLRSLLFPANPQSIGVFVDVSAELR